MVPAYNLKNLDRLRQQRDPASDPRDTGDPAHTLKCASLSRRTRRLIRANWRWDRAEKASSPWSLGRTQSDGRIEDERPTVRSTVRGGGPDPPGHSGRRDGLCTGLGLRGRGRLCGAYAVPSIPSRSSDRVPAGRERGPVDPPLPRQPVHGPLPVGARMPREGQLAPQREGAPSTGTARGKGVPHALGLRQPCDQSELRAHDRVRRCDLGGLVGAGMAHASGGSSPRGPTPRSSRS
jgi:hypothetical protein